MPSLAQIRKSRMAWTQSRPWILQLRIGLGSVLLTLMQPGQGPR
jgi:hypothetical protein